MNTTVYWGDGTSDTITVSSSGAVGSSQMTVASAPNRTLATRSRTILLRDAAGAQLATLTVTQQIRNRDYNPDYNNDYY